MVDGRPSIRLSKYWPDKPRLLVTSILTKHSVLLIWDSVSIFYLCAINTIIVPIKTEKKTTVRDLDQHS